jgi:hypothetical protein
MSRDCLDESPPYEVVSLRLRQQNDFNIINFIVSCRAASLMGGWERERVGGGEIERLGGWEVGRWEEDY